MRRNTDEGLRRRERASRAEPSDRAARQDLLKAELRAGRIPVQSVRLAALLGDEDAGVVVGIAADPVLSVGFQTPGAMQFWVNKLARTCAVRESLPRERVIDGLRVYVRGKEDVRAVTPGLWLAAVEVTADVFLMERPDLDLGHLRDETADLRQILSVLREETLRVIDGGRPDRELVLRLMSDSDALFERVSNSMIVPGMEALPEAAAAAVTAVNVATTLRQAGSAVRMTQGLLESAVLVISLGDSPTTARMGDWHELSRRVRERMIYALLRHHARGVWRLPRRNSGDMPLIPLAKTGDNLPAIPTQTLPRHEWRPPRVSFDLMLSGKAPFTYLPEGAYEHPPLTATLGRLLTRQGIADVNAWEDLLAQCGSTRAKLYVVDRAGERYQVVGVEFDFGGDTGQLLVRHLGSRSRGGDLRIDIHQAFGKMLPVVVYSSTQRNSGDMTAQELFDAVSARWKAGDMRHPKEIVGQRPETHKPRWVWDVLVSSMESYRFPKEVDGLLRKVAHTCHLDMETRWNSDEDLRALERKADTGDREAFLAFLRGRERTGHASTADLMPAIEFFYDNDLSDPLPGTGRSTHAIALAEAELAKDERDWQIHLSKDDYYNSQRKRTESMKDMRRDEIAVEVMLIDPTPTGPGNSGTILDSVTPIFLRDESFDEEPEDLSEYPPDVRVAAAYMALKALKAERT